MNEINLDKFKSAWNLNNDFNREILSDLDIRRFMQGRSKSLESGFSRLLLFDVIVKAILMVLFVIILYFSLKKVFVFYSSLFIIFFILAEIVWQMKVYNKVPNLDKSSVAVSALLKEYSEFNSKYYKKSLYLTALSSPLFFWAGTLFYQYVKYKWASILAVDDYFVLLAGLIISYALSAFVHIKQNYYEMRQLRDCLYELDNEKDAEQSVNQFKKKRKKNKSLIYFGLVIGLMVLIVFFMIYRFGG